MKKGSEARRSALQRVLAMRDDVIVPEKDQPIPETSLEALLEMVERGDHLASTRAKLVAFRGQPERTARVVGPEAMVETTPAELERQVRKAKGLSLPERSGRRR